jgi:5-methyltetrahydrofolate--homocysteine methyltransferase
MPTGVCPELWCIEHPDVIGAVHAAYKAAGAGLVYTCTFGGNAKKLAQYGCADVFGVNKRLAQIARDAVGADTLVAGDIGPCGHFVAPFGELTFEDAVSMYREQARGLLAGGVDCFVIETQMDIQESRAALIAVRELCDLPVIVTMTYEQDGRTLNGTDPKAALIILQSLGADAVGCNCSAGPERMLELVREMTPYATLPLVAKANAGLPRLVDGKTVFDMDAQSFASFASAFVDAGVACIGGCCGTSPEHIAAVAGALREKRPPLPALTALGAVASARRSFVFAKDTGFAVIGERINPTGKKDLQAELAQGRLSRVREMAKEQELAGADLLDVNVGMPGVDEKALLLSAVEMLSTASPLPLVIDTSDMTAMEAALRVYPGRALINSISAETKKLAEMLPIARKYGAMFIALPLTDDAIPPTAKERCAVVERIYGAAAPFGFAKDDLVVDVVAMAVSSDARAAVETLETVAWCTANGFKTTMGLSNVSFGLPERKWANATFLALATAKGLSSAIANPCIDEFMHVKASCDVLLARDKDAGRYIARFGAKKEQRQQAETKTQMTPRERLFACVVEGAREDVLTAVQAALSAGETAPAIVHEVMIPAITKVGDLFDKKTYFLPQLIASAETMQRGFTVLEPLLKDVNAAEKKDCIVFATVEGDIHDIGKNIVVLMLRNHGFEVVDLGKDVKTAEVLAAICAHQPVAVGLSALMTTTMVRMKEVVETARAQGITVPFMVGGAAVTPSFATAIGARYSKDGVDAVALAKELAR